MGSVRIGRVNDELMKTLSELLRTVRDPRVTGLVSIVRVETAPDLGSARVYVSVLGDENARRDCIKGITSASGYLRREAARRLRLRYTPELTFVADDSIVSGTHIMELIDNVAKKDDDKRKLIPETAAEFLKTRDDILILTHKSPDGDTVGSAAALAIALSSLGKRAYLFENTEMSARLRRRAKAYFAPEGFVPKCVIAVDIADKKLFCEGAEEFAENVDLSIDHHITHKPYSRRACVVAESAACGEIVYDIVKLMGVKITKKLADLLYIAISTDTGRFLHANTTPETHIKAAELISHGADFEAINREFFVEKSAARLALEAEILSGLKLCFGGKVGIITLSAETIRKTKATEDDLEGISALARVAKGVSLGVYIHEKNGAIKVSLRSDERVNSAEFCAFFGGGGHERAAGCTMDCTLSEAVEKIVTRIEELQLF
ncbi:MAG: 30S ribosome-binding factor RbfA [Oscillospiraceae bacterium]|nr:30S ribosome-binding factor RbfA [Oscillospiraceae bacterium]